MNKFKVGDTVRCVKPSAAIGVHVGQVYTVKGYNDHCRKFGCVLLDEVGSSPFEACFELVQEDAVLTPEEVFEHLRKGTQLQCSDKGKDNWCNIHLNRSVSVGQIESFQWRIKPEPEVIELNGKRYKLIEE